MYYCTCRFKHDFIEKMQEGLVSKEILFIPLIWIKACEGTDTLISKKSLILLRLIQCMLSYGQKHIL